MGERADRVRDRAVGERTKSVVSCQHVLYTTRVISTPRVPGFPSPLSASAANRTSGSSILTLVSRLLVVSSGTLRMLAVSMGLPMSSREKPSGTLGKVALLGAGSTPQCGASKCARGLYSIELCGVWRALVSGRCSDLMPGSRALSWWLCVGRCVGTDGRCSDSGSCCVYAGGGAGWSGRSCSMAELSLSALSVSAWLKGAALVMRATGAPRMLAVCANHGQAIFFAMACGSGAVMRYGGQRRGNGPGRGRGKGLEKGMALGGSGIGRRGAN